MYKKIVVFLFLILILLGIGRMAVSNNISTSGTVLGELNEQINNYKTENLILSEKVLDLSSLAKISEKAEKLGFVESENAFSITNSLPVAIKQ